MAQEQQEVVEELENAFQKRIRANKIVTELQSTGADQSKILEGNETDVLIVLRKMIRDGQTALSESTAKVIDAIIQKRIDNK